MCDACTYYKSEAARNKDFRQGAINPDVYDEEVNYSPKTKAKKTKKRYPGCPGNDKGPHIYVWTTEKNNHTLFFEHYGFHKYEKRICVGCNHVDRKRTTQAYRERNAREKDKAARRGQRTYKYWTFEDHDEEYREVRRRYISRHGWDEYAYNGMWWA